jgi:hypothetical protein
MKLLTPALLMAVLHAQDREPRNLIVHGGFEEADGSVPIGWTFRTADGGAVEFSSCAERPREGGRCLSLKGKGDWAGVFCDDPIALEKDQDYVLSAWIRVKSGRASLTIDYFADHDHAGRQESKFVRSRNGADTWRKLTLGAGLNRFPGATHIKISIMAFGTLELWIDEARLEKGSEPPAEEKVVRLAPGVVTRFTGDGAVSRDPAVDFPRPLSIWLSWSGPGGVTWKVVPPRPDDYEVALVFASAADEARATVTAGESRAEATLRKSRGMFQNPWSNGYERTRLTGSVRLPEQGCELTLRIEPPPGKKSEEFFRLHTVELTPLSAKAALEADDERARKARASSDWLVQAGYGLMTHWTARTHPRHGPKKPYDEAVKEFDVGRFADMARDSGAGYVIFTLHHGDHACPAPLESWEKLHPCSTTRRDLIGELADALAARGLKLMLYLSPNSIGGEPQDLAFWSSGNWPFLPEAGGDELFDAHERVFTELGRRYGERLAGFWFDGIMPIYLKYPHYPFERMFRALKTGHPGRLVSWNTWVMPNCTPWQEYWAGEGFSPDCAPPASRYLERDGGLQSQGLFILDDDWGHFERDKPIRSPLYSNARLTEFVQGCIDRGCPVTLNVATYQDGGVSPETLDQLKAVRKAVRGE